MPRTCWTKADLDLRYSERDKGSRSQCQQPRGQKLTLTQFQQHLWQKLTLTYISLREIEDLGHNVKDMLDRSWPLPTFLTRLEDLDHNVKDMLDRS